MESRRFSGSPFFISVNVNSGFTRSQAALYADNVQLNSS
jgi:hypothetical protein